MLVFLHQIVSMLSLKKIRYLNYIINFKQKKMKKTALITMLALTVNVSFSQEMKTLFSQDTSKKGDSYGGYGAPFVGYTEYRDGSSATIVGGKGGVIKNHTFVFGGVGTAIIGNKNYTYNVMIPKIGSAATANDSAATKNTNISMGYGGIFVEYILNYSNPIHISFPLNIQVGGVLAGSKNGDMKVKSSSIFVIEPGINFEFNFYKNFIPGINIGYRYVDGTYSKELSGAYASLLFKFGKF